MFQTEYISHSFQIKAQTGGKRVVFVGLANELVLKTCCCLWSWTFSEHCQGALEQGTDALSSSPNTEKACPGQLPPSHSLLL